MLKRWSHRLVAGAQVELEGREDPPPQEVLMLLKEVLRLWPRGFLGGGTGAPADSHMGGGAGTEATLTSGRWPEETKCPRTAGVREAGRGCAGIASCSSPGPSSFSLSKDRGWFKVWCCFGLCPQHY